MIKEVDEESKKKEEEAKRKKVLLDSLENERRKKLAEELVVRDYMKATEARVSYARNVHKDYVRRSNHS